MSNSKEAKEQKHQRSMIDVRPSQLIQLLIIAFTNKLRVLVIGEPGIGKSELVAQAAAAAGMDLLLSHPVVEDPTVPAGMPNLSTSDEYATFKPFGTLYKALTAKNPTVWFLDDFGQAAPATQAAYMQLLLAGQINDHVLPDNVVFVAATNERAHKSGVMGMLEPVKDRFHVIVRLKANLEDSKKYFYANNAPPEMIAFLESRPDLLSDFNPTNDMSKSPSPRSWSMCAKWVRMALDGTLPSDLHGATFAGCIGEGAALELKTHLNTVSKMPDVDKIIKNPEKGEIPEDPSIMYAVIASLAYKANNKTFDNILTYALRLEKEKKGEYAVLLIRDSLGRDDSLRSFIGKIANSPIGKLINQA